MLFKIYKILYKNLSLTKVFKDTQLLYGFLYFIV